MLFVLIYQSINILASANVKLNEHAIDVHYIYLHSHFPPDTLYITYCEQISGKEQSKQYLISDRVHSFDVSFTAAQNLLKTYQ